MGLGQYYDSLARFQRFVQRFGHRGGFDPLTVHRLLESNRADISPADVVHDRVLHAVNGIRAPRVLDAGCGVGGTILYLHHRLGGQYDGLTLSPVQRARASQEAARRGVAGACRFHVRNYDLSLEPIVPDGADLIVAIESLAHAADPAWTIAHFAASLRPAGRLVIVDDVPVATLAADDPDFAAFRAGWACPHIANDRAWCAAFDRAGLAIEHEEDLTPLVRKRNARELQSLIRTNRRWRRWLGDTAAGALVDSLHGGLMLERLYARELIRYRLMTIVRVSTAHA